eukprot:6181915-Pleurochrysis_carterae.AAC.3
MSQTCQYRHSPHQSFVDHSGSASCSDHSLDAPVVCKIKGIQNEVVPGLSWNASGALRCVASLYDTNTAVQKVAVLHRHLRCLGGRDRSARTPKLLGCSTPPDAVKRQHVVSEHVDAARRKELLRVELRDVKFLRRNSHSLLAERLKADLQAAHNSIWGVRDELAEPRAALKACYQSELNRLRAEARNRRAPQVGGIFTSPRVSRAVSKQGS